jgi:hypothetical protein
MARQPSSAPVSAPFIPEMLADGRAWMATRPAPPSGAIEELAACIRIHGAVSKAALKTVLAALRETA